MTWKRAAEAGYSHSLPAILTQGGHRPALALASGPHAVERKLMKAIRPLGFRIRFCIWNKVLSSNCQHAIRFCAERQRRNFTCGFLSSGSSLSGWPIAQALQTWQMLSGTQLGPPCRCPGPRSLLRRPLWLCCWSFPGTQGETALTRPPATTKSFVRSWRCGHTGAPAPALSCPTSLQVRRRK